MTTPSDAGSAAVLRLSGVGIRFGGVRAVESVSFDVAAGEIRALIGPNGAGKTTLFNAVSGLLKPSAGTITYRGAELIGQRPHEIVSSGIARTFQNLALCESLTVLENVMMGAHSAGRSGFVAAALGWGIRAEERRLRELAQESLRTVGLEHLGAADVGGLPYGTLKRVELARALATGPSVLLLDEPAGGLPHGEVDELAELIRSLRDRLGVSIILVEHHMAMVMSTADRVCALASGRIIADGTPAEVQSDPAVTAAYLGVPA